MELLAESHLSFSIARKDVNSRILIPKYYDPELSLSISEAAHNFDLPTLGSILAPGQLGSRLGTWIPREHYGSGSVPYVRTSDLNSWRIRPDHKKSVSRAVHSRVAARQDVKPDDLLMVAHGTYLVGTVAIVTPDDLPFVLQDHIFRLRCSPTSTVGPHLLLGALSTRFVKRQMRARQFSADIIDKIGDRHLGIRVPLPKNTRHRAVLAEEVRSIVSDDAEIRREIIRVLGSDLRITRERASARLAFTISRKSIKRRTLIPKYYDPVLNRDLQEARDRTDGSWTTIGALVEGGLLAASTGVEVGKMAYGTGDIPFVRTTDIADLTVKSDPRQGVAQDIYQKFFLKAGILGGDILIVRDGTYLVGSSAIVTDGDTPGLISGGVYRLRCPDHKQLNPYTLLALLNHPLSRRQMRAKQFTRDVIDTLGQRLFEVQIPNPMSVGARMMGSDLEVLIGRRAQIAYRIRGVIDQLEPAVPQQSLGRPGWSMRY